MSTIHILDELTANQIAAGEVVERPVSVAKELIENSLDAGATNICVEIGDGGLTNIKVTDDGYGMSQEDILLAVKRHATSKLQKITDLDTLKTLGFRGEALSAITAVSRTTILSRQQNQDFGVKVSMEGNKLVGTEPAGCSIGTTVTVADLFFNTPARLKFMKSAGYEGGLIYDLLVQFSLSHPKINFSLLQQGKETLNTKGIDTLPDLIELFYGQKAREALINLQGEITGGYVDAYITSPVYHRANRKAISFFINSRRIISPELMQIVEEAFANTIPKGRFPAGVFRLSIDPSRIDVNVHPGKLEVRFRDQCITAELYNLLKECLSKKNSTAIFAATQVPLTLKPDPVPASDCKPKVPAVSQTYFREFLSWDGGKHASLTVKENPPEEKKEETTEKEIPSVEEYAKDFPTGEEYIEDTSQLPLMKIIGQYDNTFILAEGENYLYLVDQHAAHERILFERYMELYANRQIESQLLLQPIPLKLTPLEEEYTIEHIVTLHDLGVIIEHFGPRSYVLRSVPSFFQGDPEEFFFSMLEYLTKTAGKPTAAELHKAFLVLASCKGAIKANQKLPWEAMERLLADLSLAKNPLTCPHGRPVLIKLAKDYILKNFGRK